LTKVSLVPHFGIVMSRIRVMSEAFFIIVIGTFVISFVLTGLVRSFFYTRGIIDVPNARSSHSIPKPRGGGLAITVAGSAALVWLLYQGFVDHDLAWALLGGGIPVAWIGFCDDRRPVSVLTRLAVHVASASWVIWSLGGLPSLQIGRQIVDLGILGDCIGVLTVMWVLNLFNFMDGIDGIAASESVFVTTIGGLIGLLSGASTSVTLASFAIAAGSAGFLAWNWPPARIFMGDIGSGYLGLVIATLAVAAGRDNPQATFVWLILGALFFTDATCTLVQRLFRGEKVYEAHCSHGYQILTRKLGSHRSVTIGFVTVNVLVLGPLAVAATVLPEWSAALAVFSVVATGFCMYLWIYRKPETSLESER
jgi:Fuc2NAc and GlcNAc transferase